MEVTRISDKQLSIEQMLLDINSSSNIPSSTIQDNEVDYFIYNWPISDDEGLNNLEEKIRTDLNFKKQVCDFY